MARGYLCQATAFGASRGFLVLVRAGPPSKEYTEDTGGGITMNGLKFLVCLAVVVAGVLAPGSHTGADSSKVQPGPTLINTCLITANVGRLVNFYESVLGIKGQRSGEDYAEFHTGVGVLAIFSAEAQEKYIPGSAKAASNGSAILEFKVGDVDSEYARLQSLVKTWVKPPTNQPWGTRSVYFRDPDGNLVNFFMLAKREDRVKESEETEQRITALRAAYAAFNKGDISAAVDSLDAEIEWAEPAEFPGGGTYHGREGAKQYLAQSRAAWAEVISEPEQFIPAGNRIVVFVHARLLPKNSGEWHETRLADVYTFRDGKAIQMRAFADRQEALRWAGGDDSSH